MRSNWTSQPTSCTSTFTPVLAVNGATIFSRSSFGLGELGIVHSVRVTPFCSWSPVAALAFVGADELLSLPPQAATTRAIAAVATASFIRTSKLLRNRVIDLAKTFLLLRKKRASGSGLQLTSVVEPRTTRSTGRIRRGGRWGSPAIR